MMHRYSFRMLAVVLVIATGCQTGTDDPDSAESPRGFDDIFKIAELDAFWTAFTSAVADEDSVALLDLIQFPLGKGPGNNDAYSDREVFLATSYSDVFGEDAYSSRIVASTVRNLVETETGFELPLKTDSSREGPTLIIEKVTGVGFRLTGILWHAPPDSTL